MTRSLIVNTIQAMQKIIGALLILVLSAGLAYWLTTDNQVPVITEKISDISSVPECAALTDDDENMVWIEGGQFTMGSSDFYPDEGPVKNVEVEGFWIDRYEVSNAQFARFVDETGYITVAEQQLNPADYPDIPPDQLIPGSVVFIMPTRFSEGGSLTDWWRFIPGTNWREPLGPGSSIEGKENYPVVHVAYDDALAYAEWAGRELPTEAQWEYAARGGLENKTFAWGDEFRPDDKWRANTWQGMFPAFNEGEDGHLATAPVGCYPANGYGLHDMTGNVWEWVDDWYFPGHQQADTSKLPHGYDPRQPHLPVKVIKGGSYLCAKNFCMRYRPSARHAQETTLGAAHIGFRTVRKQQKS